MKFTIPIDAVLSVNNQNYKGFGTGLFTQLRLFSDKETVVSTGQQIGVSGVYEFEVTGANLIMPLALFVCATENGIYDEMETWGGTAGKQLKEYLSFAGLLNQAGTDAPTLTIVNNDFNEEPVMVYDAIGEYFMGFTTAWFGDISKVLFLTGAVIDYGTFLLRPGVSKDNELYVASFNNANNLANDVLSDSSFEIRIYP